MRMVVIALPPAKVPKDIGAIYADELEDAHRLLTVHRGQSAAKADYRAVEVSFLSFAFVMLVA